MHGARARGTRTLDLYRVKGTLIGFTKTYKTAGGVECCSRSDRPSDGIGSLTGGHLIVGGEGILRELDGAADALTSEDQCQSRTVFSRGRRHKRSSILPVVLALRE